MFTTTEGQTLYTQEEVDALNNRINEQYQVGVDHATNAITNKLRTKAIEWFKAEVRGGSMIKEDALGIYNGLADALGWELVDNLSTLYTVTVSFSGTTIGEFSDIEADDEDSAIQEVSDNLEVEDAEISFVISYNGNTCRESANVTWDFDDTELQFDAEEQ
jgi:hypothetical protein